MTLVLPVTTTFGGLPGLGGRTAGEEACDWLQGRGPCPTASTGTQTGPFSGVTSVDSQSRSGFKVPERCRVEVNPPRRPLTPPPTMGNKRKLPLDDMGECRPRRISPLHNTPKQRRDEKRRVLRLSIQKLRQIDDPEVFLRRSVLINNTMKRMQRELRQEKYASSYRGDSSPPPSKRACAPEPAYEVTTPSASPSYMHLFDDPPNHFVNERITDDMSDSLVRTVMGLGDCATSNCTSSCCKPSTNTPTPTPSPNSGNNPSPQCTLPSSTPPSLLSGDACPKSKDCPMDLDESSSDSDSEPNNNSRLCPNHNDPPSPSKDPGSMEITDLTSYFPEDKYVNVTERDRQILGEMDAVFNNLISVLTEA